MISHAEHYIIDFVAIIYAHVYYIYIYIYIYIYTYIYLVFASEVNTTLRTLIGLSDAGYPVLSTSGRSSATVCTHSSHI